MHTVGGAIFTVSFLHWAEAIVVIDGKVRTSAFQSSQTFFAARKYTARQPRSEGLWLPRARGKLSQMQIQSQSATKTNWESRIALNPSWGPGSPCEDVSVCIFLAKGTVVVRWQKQLLAVIMWRGFAMSLSPLPSLSPFSLSPSAFVWEDPGVFF